VPRVVYSANALANLERSFDHLRRTDPDVVRRAAAAIRGAVEMLRDHPFVGRAVAGELRELVISFGRTGYVALYRFVPARDQVRILAIRHQRELGYPR
jgi:plasmid stabilization system protein ParE